MMTIDAQPQMLAVNESTGSDSATLQAGIADENKILGGTGKGISQCIIEGRLDPQITYIANNLTTMSLTIYLPDVAAITEGFGGLSVLQNSTNQQTESENQSENTTQTQQQRSIENRIASFNTGSIANPFEQVQQALDGVELININTQVVALDVPLLTDEQINAYDTRMQVRLDYNSEVIKQRGDVVNSTLNVCGRAANIDVDGQAVEQLVAQGQAIEQALRAVVSDPSISLNRKKIAQQCLDIYVRGTIDDLIVFQDNMTQITQRVQANMQALQTYKLFPGQVAALMHGIDQYVLDTVIFVDSFFNQINNRLATNAAIFNGYVDAIIGITNAVKTRQALIDFSNNRKSSCSTCTNDNYGAHSCSLGFMCPQLPVLPIPPMKIPDIYVDLSHIDSQVDILLPELQLNTVPLELPTLPNLPIPPQIQVDVSIEELIELGVDLGALQGLGISTISLPDIPEIPPAPTLPQLPAIIPVLDINLPLLPPPPEVPQITPEISTTLEA
jgi:hypothetical protein